MRALVLAGGTLTATPALRRLAAEADWVVAADSGLRHAATLGVTPTLVVGDFDSVRPADLGRYPGLPQERHPTDKDLLDLELALMRARSLGAREVVVVGGLGGRFDQTLASVLIAARLQGEGLKVSLHDGATTVYFVAAGESLSLALPPKTRFSLLSLRPVSRVDLRGARYELERARLEFGSGLGVSNETKAERLELSLSAGLLAVVVEAT